jgi:hypothetical protein
MRSKPRSRTSATFVIGSLVLAVSLLFGVLSGSALGTETPPVNTALPTVSPTTPHTARKVTASKGTWTGAPTSYTYAWNRCSFKCEPIAGATSSEYIPVEADLGKKLTVSVTASNGAGGTTATSKETSVVKQSLSWYKCTTGGGGLAVYEDAKCSKKGTSNSYLWYRLGSIETSTTNVVNGESQVYRLKWTVQSLEQPVELTCTKAEGFASLASTEEYAKLTWYELVMNSCSVVETGPGLKGCKIKGSKLVFNSLTGKSPESPEKLTPEIRLEGPPASVLTSFQLEGCSFEWFNGEYTVTGWFPAQINNSTSVMSSSNEESREHLNVNYKGISNKFGIEGASAIATLGGKEPVKLDVAP